MSAIAPHPPRRSAAIWIAAGLACLAITIPAVGDDEVAGRIFLEGFLKREAAMKAEAERDFQTAYQMYVEASRLYDRLALEYPDWKPSIVAMRREGFAREIQNVEGKAKQMDEGRPVPREPKPPAADPRSPATDPRPAPPAVREDLPSWERERNPGAGGLPARVLPSGPGVAIRPPTGQQPPAAPPDAREIAAPLQRRIDALESLLAAANRERDALKQSLADTENRRQRAEKELERAQADRRSLNDQLSMLREEKVNDAVAATARDTRIAELEKQLDALNTRIGEARGEAEDAIRQAEEMKALAAAAQGERDKLAADLKTSMAETETMRKASEAEIEKLRVERDALARVLVEGAAANQETIAGVAQRFERELADARARIEKMTGEKTSDAETIAALRTQLAVVEGELASARREAAASQSSLAALRAELESAREKLEVARGDLAAREVASKPDPSQDARLAEENLVLREIVIRQLRQQTYRARARELLLAEMAKMEIDSKSMLALLDQMEGKEAMPDAAQVARVRDPYIEALAGVGLSAEFFQSQEDPAEDIDGQEIADAGSGESPEPGQEQPTAAASQAADHDVREAFEFQKRSLGETAARAFEAGEFATAEETYRLIVQADPGDHRMICNLGVSLLRQERFSDALQVFHQALSVHEQDAYAHLMMGVCHWKLGQHRLAADRIHRSLTIQPGNPLAWLHLGLVAADASDYPAADSAFKKALEADPDYAPAYYNLAVIHTKPGFADPPEAARRYERAVKLGSPRDPALEDFLRLGPGAPPGFDF